jgi:hypothetical protein
MNTQTEAQTTNPYSRTIAASKRARWDLDKDVLRGRSLEPAHKCLPDGLSLAQSLEFLSEEQRRFWSQVQGRSYANIFGLVERYIVGKVLEVSRDYLFSDQVALEALVRFSDEELKHQELFRRVEVIAAQGMPPGYRFVPDPNEVARAVLTKSTWAVLGLTCHIELFTQAHYKRSIETDDALSPLFKDVFLFHWKEESQHAVLDELEWRREDAKLSSAQRSAAVDDLIALVVAVDGILRVQSVADADYFIAQVGRTFNDQERARIHDTMLRAYRYQYIGSGIEMTNFPELLFGMVSEADAARIQTALGPLL